MTRLGINRISLFKSHVSQILLKFDQGLIIAGIGEYVLNDIKVRNVCSSAYVFQGHKVNTSKCSHVYVPASASKSIANLKILISILINQVSNSSIECKANPIFRQYYIRKNYKSY